MYTPEWEVQNCIPYQSILPVRNFSRVCHNPCSKIKALYYDFQGPWCSPLLPLPNSENLGNFCMHQGLCTAMPSVLSAFCMPHSFLSSTAFPEKASFQDLPILVYCQTPLSPHPCALLYFSHINLFWSQCEILFISSSGNKYYRNSQSCGKRFMCRVAYVSVIL